MIQALVRSAYAGENQSLTPPAPPLNSSRDGATAPRSPTPSPATSQTNAPLVRSGLLFLLKQKDRYGVWYSTQATINVLDTMMALLAMKSSDGGQAVGQRSAQLVINGRSVQSIQLPNTRQLAAPITLDISRFIRGGGNRARIGGARTIGRWCSC